MQTVSLDANGCLTQPRCATAAAWIFTRFGSHPFHHVIKHWATHHGRQVALRVFNVHGDEVGRRTYEDLYERAVAVSLYLRQVHGVTKGDRVILCFTPGIDFAIAVVACLFLGSVAVPVYPVDPRKQPDVSRFTRTIAITCPRLILTHRTYTRLIGRWRKSVPLPQHNTETGSPIPWVHVEDSNCGEDGAFRFYDHDHADPPAVRPPPSPPVTVEEEDRTPRCWEPPTFDPVDIVIIQFSSGSTRAPQGVAISYCGLIYNIHASLIAMRGGSSVSTDPLPDGHPPMYFDLRTSTIDTFYDYILERQRIARLVSGHHLRLFTWLPLYHDMGLIGSLLGGLFCGQEVIMVSSLDFLRRPAVWLELMSQFRCSAVATPNFGLDLVTRKMTDQDVVQSLDLRATLDCGLLCGAEPVRARTLCQFVTKFEAAGVRDAAINPAYGLAENTLIVTARAYAGLDAEPTIVEVKLDGLKPGYRVEVTRGPWDLSTYRKMQESGTSAGTVLCVGCGTPEPNTHVVIVDPHTLRAVADGVVGEVWVASPSGAAGYWRDGELTRRMLCASYYLDGETMSRPKYIRTGDWGFLLQTSPAEAAPELFLAGRLKDTLLVRGRTYHAKDIEEHVEETYPKHLRGGRVAAIVVQNSCDSRSRQTTTTTLDDDNPGDDPHDQLVILAEVRRQQLAKAAGTPRFLCLFLGRSNAMRATVHHLARNIQHDIRAFSGLRVDHVVLLRQGSLPVTSSGKIRRHAAKDMYLGHHLPGILYTLPQHPQRTDAASERCAPRETQQLEAPPCDPLPETRATTERPLSAHEIQQQLCTLFVASDVLHPDDIERFRDGGQLDLLDLDSLTAVELARKLTDQFGVDIPPTVFYDWTTLDDVVQLLLSGSFGMTPPPQALCVADRHHDGRQMAVVGLGCRLPVNKPGQPSGRTAEAFWDSVLAPGWCSVVQLMDTMQETPVPQTTTVVAANGKRDSQTSHNQPSSKSFGCFLPELDVNPPFADQHRSLGISLAEYTLLDPHQKMLIDVVGDALASIAETPWAAMTTQKKKNVAVVIGCCSAAPRNTAAVAAAAAARMAKGSAAGPAPTTTVPSPLSSPWGITASLPSMMANRISYCFHFEGPSLLVDTACSSSLVALDVGSQYLFGQREEGRRRSCEAVIVASVNLILDLESSRALGHAGVLAPDGRCKTFDARADGYGRGEGGCAFILVPWHGHETDAMDASAGPVGRRPLAVILSTAVNQDGRTIAMTAPSGTAQTALIRAGLQTAGVPPQSISYIECHGTGTQLGDPIEVNALSAVFGVHPPPSHQPWDGDDHVLSEGNNVLHLGSVKTNVGHLEGAAGIAGLLKLLLTLGYRQVPPVANFISLNPLIHLSRLRAAVHSGMQPIPLHPSETTRATGSSAHAGLTGTVSSFGLGGTNAFAVVRGYHVPTGADTTTCATSDFASLCRKASCVRTMHDGIEEPATTTAEDGRHRQLLGLLNPQGGVFWPPLALPAGLHWDVQKIRTAVESLVQSVLQKPVPYLDWDAPLRDMGLDSLAAVELASTLSRQFGLSLSATTLFDYPSLNAITNHILQLQQDGAYSPSGGWGGVVTENGVATTAGSSDPLAVVGMALRFPGSSNSPQAYWNMLTQGTHHAAATDDAEDCATVPPLSRWRHLQRWYDPSGRRPGTTSVKAAAFIDAMEAESLDCGFFDLSPLECEDLDPNQALMMAVGTEALIRSMAPAYNMKAPAPTTGVYIGHANSEWAFLGRNGGIPSAYASTGSGPSLIAGRLAYTMGLTGPALVIDTACSSSLVACDVAAGHLRSGIIQRALVGGVSLMLAPHPFVLLSHSGMLAHDGKSRPFDVDASGYGRGEGCGAIVLMTLRSAKRLLYPSRILAHLWGTAVAHDGHDAPLTAPSGRTQQRIIRAALRRSGNLSPDSVVCLESHGTGTRLGDPIEVGALAAVFRHALSVTGVKGHIGHLEGAAGIAGLIKTVLMLHYRQCPPIRHLTELNPHVIQNLDRPSHGVDDPSAYGPLQFIVTGGLDACSREEKLQSASRHLRAGPVPLVQSTHSPHLPTARARERGVNDDNTSESSGRETAETEDQVEHLHGPTLYAGVSSFSYSGTNAHAILSSAPPSLSVDISVGEELVPGTAHRVVFIIPDDMASLLALHGRLAAVACAAYGASFRRCARRIEAARGTTWSGFADLLSCMQYGVKSPGSVSTAAASTPAQEPDGWAKNEGALAAAAILGAIVDFWARRGVVPADVCYIRAQQQIFLPSSASFPFDLLTAKIPAPEEEDTTDMTGLLRTVLPNHVELHRLDADARPEAPYGIKAETRTLLFCMGCTDLTWRFNDAKRGAPMTFLISDAIKMLLEDDPAAQTSSDPSLMALSRLTAVEPLALYTPTLRLPWGELSHPILNAVPTDAAPAGATTTAWHLPAAILEPMYQKLYGGHRVEGHCYIPAAGLCELLAASWIQRVGSNMPQVLADGTSSIIAVHDVAFAAPWMIRSGAVPTPDVTITLATAPAKSNPVQKDDCYIRITKRVRASDGEEVQEENDGSESLLCDGWCGILEDRRSMRLAWTSNVTDQTANVEPAAAVNRTVSTDGAYEALRRIGFSYTDSYCVLRTVELRRRPVPTAYFVLERRAPVTGDADGLIFPPEVLDGALQAAALLALDYEAEAAGTRSTPSKNSDDAAALMLPVGLDSVSVDMEAFGHRETQGRRRRRQSLMPTRYVGCATIRPDVDSINGTLRAVFVDLCVFTPVPDASSPAPPPLKPTTLMAEMAAAHREPVLTAQNVCWRRVRPTRPPDNKMPPLRSDLFWTESLISGQALPEADEAARTALQWPITLLRLPANRSGTSSLLRTPTRPESDVVAALQAAFPRASITATTQIDMALPESLETSKGRRTPHLLFILFGEIATHAEVDRALWDVTRVCACLLKTQAVPTRIYCVTTATAPMTLKGGLRGMLRAAQLEMESTLGVAVPISLVSLHPTVNVLEALSRLMINEADNNTGVSPPPPSCVMSHETYMELLPGFGTRVARFVNTPIPFLSVLAVNKALNDKRVWLISGGCGRLGQSLVKWLLAKPYAPRLAILVTTRRPEVVTLDRNLEQLRVASLSKETYGSEQCTRLIYVAQCDVNSREAVDSLFHAVYRNLGIAIDAVVHAAGIVKDSSIARVTEEEFCRVVDIKAAGAQNLCTTWDRYHGTRSATSNTETRLTVFFSSTAAALGNFGQINYAAANGCLDQLAREETKENARVVISIQWGPWEIGMSQDVADMQRQLGLNPIEESEGWRTFEALIAHRLTCSTSHDTESSSTPLSVVAYQDINWSLLGRAYQSSPAMFGNLNDKTSPSVKSMGNKTAQQIVPPLPGEAPTVTTSTEAAALVNRAIRDALIRLRGEDGHVPEDVPIFDLGLDSLGAVELRHLLATSLGVPLSSTVLFEHPTLADVKVYLVRLLEQKYGLPSKSDTQQQIQRTVQHSTAQLLLPPSDAAMYDDVIAVTGMACRFPKSPSVDTFWNNLRAGVDCIGDIPEDRWDVEAFYNADPAAVGSIYVKQAGFISDVHLFDHEKFRITKVEAQTMDPQQRLFLEVGRTALEDAAWIGTEKALRKPLSDWSGRVGVFVGVCLPDWTYSLDPEKIQVCSGTGLVPSLVSNRFSYVFGLTGPSFSVDTACSSSLVAVDLAVQKLRTACCDAAIVGGVQLNLSPYPFIAFCKARMLSPSGRSRTFDASADGYGRGEGCGVVVLERMSREGYADATRHRAVWGTITGTAIGHDGQSANLIAPNGASQQAVIRSALDDAKMDAQKAGSCMTFFETHGTGTALGDPIETSALQAVLRQIRSHELTTHFPPSIILGATKTNIGHLEGAAGIAGLIKTLLVLCQGQAPPVLHLKQLNPLIELEPYVRIPVGRVSDLDTPSMDTDDALCMYGGVSSFGFGGALSHCIVGRGTRQCDTQRGPQARPQRRPLLFVFTGQGAYTVGIGRSLFARFPLFRDTVKAVEQAARPWVVRGAEEWGDRAFRSTDAHEEDKLAPRSTCWIAQLATFTIEVGIVALLAERGIHPDLVIGHSLGEYAAAVGSGALPLATAASLVAARAKRLVEERARDDQKEEEEGMVACGISEVEAKGYIQQQHLEDSVWISAVNGQRSVVLGGTRHALQTLVTKAEQPDSAKDPIIHGKTVWLDCQRAFHTPRVDVARVHFVDDATCILERRAPNKATSSRSCRFVSTITASEIEPDILRSVQYWADHMVLPVQFYKALKAVCHADQKLAGAVEIGPKCVLTSLIHAVLGPESMCASADSWGDVTIFEAKVQQLTDWRRRSSSGSDEASREITYTKGSSPPAAFPLPRATRRGDAAGGDSERTVRHVDSDDATAGLQRSIAQLFLETTGVDWDNLQPTDALQDTRLDSLSFFVFRDTFMQKHGVEIPLAFFTSQRITKAEVEDFLLKAIRPPSIAEELPRPPPGERTNHGDVRRPGTTPWLQLLPSPRRRIRLVCFPYGGGSTDVFAAWADLAPPTVEIVPVVLPGRGRHLAGKCLDDAIEAARQFVDNTAPILCAEGEPPFALLGVSVGAIIAYEAILLMMERGLRLPTRLFAVCCAAPDIYQQVTVHAAETYRRFKRRRTASSVHIAPEKPCVVSSTPRNNNNSSSSLSLREVVDMLHQTTQRGGQEKQDPSPCEVSLARRELAKEFVFDFLAAANYRGMDRLRENPTFGDMWAEVFACDAAMALNYTGAGRPKLSVGITAIEGSHDAVSQATFNSMRRWRKFTTAKFHYALIRGGDHYLVHGRAEEAIAVILKDLKDYIPLPRELIDQTHGRDNLMRHWYARMALRLFRHLPQREH